MSIFADTHEPSLCGAQLGTRVQGEQKWPLGAPGPAGRAVCAESCLPVCRFTDRSVAGSFDSEGNSAPGVETMAEVVFPHAPPYHRTHGCPRCPHVLKCSVLPCPALRPLLRISVSNPGLLPSPSHFLSLSLASFSISSSVSPSLLLKHVSAVVLGAPPLGACTEPDSASIYHSHCNYWPISGIHSPQR